MAALLPARLKNIALAVLAGILAAAALWTALAPRKIMSPAGVRARVERDAGRMDAVVARAVQGCLQRSRSFGRSFAANSLDAADLERREAVVVEKDGLISAYVGEIYFFRPVALAEGEWRLIQKNENVYFLRRVAADTYYLRFFMDIRSGPLQEAASYPYPVFDLKFADQPLPGAGPGFSYDRAQERFYFTRALPSSQNQFLLSLVLSRATLEQPGLRNRKALAYALAFLSLLALFFLAGRSGHRLLLPRLFCLAGMAFSAWWAIAWLTGRSIYVPGHASALRSVFQPLLLLVFLLLAARCCLGRPRRRSGAAALVLFNALALLAFHAARVVLEHVDFPYGEFALTPEYIGLLALIAGLLAVPLLAAAPFLDGLPRRRSWPLLAVQAALFLLLWRLASVSFPSPFLLALAFVILLLRPRHPWARVLLPLLLLALAVSILLGGHSLRERRAFVSENLKPIFSSQDDYAKLVAREIVYELNSQGEPLHAFFAPGQDDSLGDLWKNTLAAREGIASGIHVVAGDGAVLRSFSYQIPYIPLAKEDIFPFWHVENVEADLFGRNVRLAVATISVFQKERFLGYVMIQVLNTADLILKSRELQSILTVDRKIRDAGLGYIKLDEEQRILENPANINAEDLAALTSAPDAWVRFRSMGQAFSGHVFRIGDETAVIFYPRDSFFRSFSGFIKVLGFLLLLAALLYLRPLRSFPWRSMLGSFSVKVFAILVLLSMFTAAAFSLFSLNFNFRSLEVQRVRAVHARGRAALNVINNLLADGGEMTQRHMFLLQKILENDISVYENGTLLFTSDHRKIIRSQLPIHLNSGIRDLFRRGGRQFELRQNENTLDLFFKAAGGYVFDIEFPFDSADLSRAQRTNIDFLATIFFVLIIIGLGAAFFFRNQIVAPIHRLNRGMAEVQKGNLSPLGDIPAESELRELYQGFNAMLEGIQEQKRSASEISRMKTLVQLGRRVAHEVKNPLTPIRLSAEQIQRSLQDGGEKSGEIIASAVRYIIEEAEHLRRVAFGFLNLSKLDELKPEPFRLDDLVAETVGHLRPIYPRVHFSVRNTGGEGIDVTADRRKIQQAVDNVLTNSLEALDANAGEIDVTLGQDGDCALIRIRDNGAGIAAEDLERIAREEFSSKELGTGLGLVIARRFLELHRGTLEIDSHPGTGTTVVMRFAQHAPAT